MMARALLAQLLLPRRRTTSIDAQQPPDTPATPSPSFCSKMIIDDEDEDGNQAVARASIDSITSAITVESDDDDHEWTEEQELIIYRTIEDGSPSSRFAPPSTPYTLPYLPDNLINNWAKELKSTFHWPFTLRSIRLKFREIAMIIYNQERAEAAANARNSLDGQRESFMTNEVSNQRVSNTGIQLSPVLAKPPRLQIGFAPRSLGFENIISVNNPRTSARPVVSHDILPFPGRFVRACSPPRLQLPMLQPSPIRRSVVVSSPYHRQRSRSNSPLVSSTPSSQSSTPNYSPSKTPRAGKGKTPGTLSSDQAIFTPSKMDLAKLNLSVSPTKPGASHASPSRPTSSTSSQDLTEILLTRNSFAPSAAPAPAPARVRTMSAVTTALDRGRFAQTFGITAEAPREGQFNVPKPPQRERARTLAKRSSSFNKPPEPFKRAPSYGKTSTSSVGPSPLSGVPTTSFGDPVLMEWRPTSMIPAKRSRSRSISRGEDTEVEFSPCSTSSLFSTETPSGKVTPHSLGFTSNAQPSVHLPTPARIPRTPHHSDVPPPAKKMKKDTTSSSGSSHNSPADPSMRENRIGGYPERRIKKRGMARKDPSFFGAELKVRKEPESFRFPTMSGGSSGGPGGGSGRRRGMTTRSLSMVEGRMYL